MRVALICDWYSPRLGGIEAHLEALAKRLATAGHAIHVITSTPGPSGADASGATVHRLTANRLPWAGVVFEPRAIRQIGDIFRQEKIELVHAHVSIVAPVGIGGAFEGQRLKLPTVVTFHSFIPATPLWAWIVGRLVGASHWNATMTAVSSRVAREVGAFAPGLTFQVLPNAIDVDYWTPGSARRDADAISFAAVTRLSPKKRPMLLIDTIREIKRAAVVRRVTLRIAGSGPLQGAMKRLVTSEQLDDIVEFVGWRDQNGLRELLRASDGFLSPTIRESFGLAALEARAVGLPVVAMRESAVSDFIRDGESGLLASSDAEFVRAALRLVNDGALRARLTDHNRRVRPALTWDRSIQLHESVYSQALAGRRG